LPPDAFTSLLTNPLVTAALVTACLLMVVQTTLLCQMVSHVRTFHHGATAGMWQAGRLPPRQQYQRVEFLVGRWREPSDTQHGWLVRFWQFAVWARQLGLLVVANGSSMVLYQLDSDLEAHAAYRTTAKWTVLGLGLIILAAALTAQVCFRPFARALDNSLEAFLLATGVLVLLLGGVYDQLLSSVSLQHAEGTLSVVQTLLICVLLGGLLVATLAALWDAHRHRTNDLSAVLARAEQRLDGPIRERLLDGSIRLLRCAWLLSSEANAALGRSASGVVIMRRQQDLPEAAFFSPCKAAELFDRADRSVLVLSYRWLTAARALATAKTLVARCVVLRQLAFEPRSRAKTPTPSAPHSSPCATSSRASTTLARARSSGSAQNPTQWASLKPKHTDTALGVLTLAASCLCRKRTTTVSARPTRWQCSSVHCP
jgi:lysylphosphatidylglycerol synthetase-like protein (DUF2156 family)